jgi:hypothetical protein
VPPAGWRDLPRISLDSLPMPPDISRPAVTLGPLSSALRVAGTAETLEPGDAFADRSQTGPGPRAEPQSGDAGEPQPSDPNTIAVPSRSLATPTM